MSGQVEHHLCQLLHTNLFSPFNPHLELAVIDSEVPCDSTDLADFTPEVVEIIRSIGPDFGRAAFTATGAGALHAAGAEGGRPMTIDLAVLSAGAFLILVALIWKVYRVIDEHLSEIQADIRELHNGVSPLFLLASDFKVKTGSENAAEVAHKADGLALLRSAGLESDLAVVDELCAKLITLVPPAKAAPLISEVRQGKAPPLISGMRAERPTQFEGRKFIPAWPTRD